MGLLGYYEIRSPASRFESPQPNGSQRNEFCDKKREEMKGHEDPDSVGIVWAASVCA